MWFSSNRSRKLSISFVISLFLGVQLLGFFALPQRAHAQMDAAITAAFSGKWTWEQVQNTLVGAALGALVNGASYFMRKLAYDSAKYVASGGKGQSALAFQDGFGSYLGNTALDSAAGAIQQFGEPLGLDLCKPPDLRVQVGLQVGLQRIYDSEYGNEGGPAPRCNWSEFTSNWEQVDDMYGSKDAISERFTASLSVSDSDFGAALGLMGKLDRVVTQSQIDATQARQEGNGFKPVADIISGKIRTPAQVIQEETKSVTAKNQGDMTAGQIAGIYGSGSLQILPMALSVFANTLVSSLLQNIMDGGLFPSGGDSESSGVTDFFASNISYNRQAAEKAFSYLIATVPQRSLDTYDLVTEFSACPQTPAPGLNNCVMDGKLVEAVNLAQTGDPLTIDEAMKSGQLHENWLLIPPGRDVDNTNLPYCYSQAYCYSNIQKLRKARILPLGFEIAALKSDPDNPVTLKKVVDGFTECDPSGRPSAAFPYCHLIDPNWIIKAPEARCEARVWGPQLQQEGTALRTQECVDFSTCLKEDDKGQCISYGYCTKEKNVWHMPGDSCPAYYNTCKTYVNSVSGSVSSYLSRTLDYGACSVESKGCRAYSSEQNEDGTWKNSGQVNIEDKLLGREQMLYFNDKLSSYASCPGNAEGCSVFKDALNGESIRLKKAPEYLGCYDKNIGTPAIDWPQTRADLVGFEDKPESCSNFAQVCVQDEVGCKGYTPAQGGIEIPGIATTENLCNEQCIGYDTFKQEESNFEQSQFPMYFIPTGPSGGQTCAAQYVGCDEFTNIDALTGGGESLEYYSNLKYCERPEGENAKVFYTWEGSASQGFILQKHTLAKIDAAQALYISGLGLASGAVAEFASNSPAYADDSKTSLENNYAICNAAQYNLHLQNPYASNTSPDCRAYYDASGGVYYRLKNDTVSVSLDCRPLRKSISNLYEDEYLSGSGSVGGVAKNTLCAQKGGTWDSVNSVCNRCYNGGTYQTDPSNPAQGACVYYSIKSEADSCPATANGCRSYIGNQGNNIEVHSMNFEPDGDDTDALTRAKEGWPGNTSIEAEATQVGLHSLRITGDASYTFNAERMQSGAWYELSFWARGQTQALDISFRQDGATKGTFTLDPLTNTSIQAPIGNDWQEYTLGPVQFTGMASGTASLFLDTNESASYFIDNVRIVRIGQENDDHLYLIKNSWKTREGYDVPLLCDSTPLDAFPGEALGCRAYTTRDNEPVALSGFDRLCRVEAVGCKAMVDTYNTVSGEDAMQMNAYNVLCKRGTTSPTYPGDASKCEAKIYSDATNFETYSCTIRKGETSCYIDTAVVVPSYSDDPGATEFHNKVYLPSGCIERTGMVGLCTGNTDDLYVVTSTIVVPADSNTIYLTHRSEFVCSDEHVGCEKVGLQQQTNPDAQSNTAYSFSDTMVLNNPDHYDQTLCSEDLVGCSEYRNGNNLTYFKDPAVIGAKSCTYRDNVEISGIQYSGWFMDNVGQCQTEAGGGTNTYCSSDNECTVSGETCKKGLTACYPNQLSGSGEYGLLSQGTPGYQGYVGMCETEYSGCTELIDPADTSGNMDGEPYYVINNDRLFERTGECDSKASQKEGCVLFNMTENPNKIYNSVLTYADSMSKKYALVPIATAGTRDTNVLLKVERDRECSEWLACRTSMTVYDENNVPQRICQDYGTCNKLNSNGACADDGWADISLNNTLLSEEEYVIRNVGWGSFEYSGYSLFNKYNIGNYKSVVLDNEVYLTYLMNDSFFMADKDGDGDADFPDVGCSEVDSDSKFKKEDGDACGFDDGGRCYKQRCTYPLGGMFPDEVNSVEEMTIYLETGICKAYPEQGSPFSTQMALTQQPEQRDKKTSGEDNQYYRWDYSTKKPIYSQANVCQRVVKEDGSIVEECSCEYRKIEYKDGTIDYWPVRDTPAHVSTGGVCVGDGAINGFPCMTNDECGSTGTCSMIKQQASYFGLKGLCLEYDLSRPLGPAGSMVRMDEQYACLTWFPIQSSASTVDNYNAYQDAGYFPTLDSESNGGEYYCSLSNNVGGAYSEVDFGGTYSFEPGGTGPADGNFTLKTNPDAPPAHQIVMNRDYTRFMDSENLPWGSAGLAENCPNVKTNAGGICPLNLDDGESCGHTGMYRYIMCWADDLNRDAWRGPYEENTPIALMNIWAWRKIGTNATVLRMDMNPRGGELYPYLAFNSVDYITSLESQVAKDDASLLVPEIFAPSIFEKNEGTYAELYDTVELGTFMHPPRLWDKAAEARDLPDTDAKNFFMSDLDGIENSDETSRDRTLIGMELEHGIDYKVETSFLTVDRVLGESMTLASMTKLAFSDSYPKIYRSTLEEKIREKDIKAIYFVPVAYPGKLEGGAPVPLLTDAFRIDFNGLRGIAGPGGREPDKIAFHERVPLTYHYIRGNSDGGYIDFFNDDGAADAGLYTYLLDKDNENGLVSFQGYDDSSPYEFSGKILEVYKRYPALQTLNEIEHRYMGVYHEYYPLTNTEKQTPEFLPNTDLVNGIAGQEVSLPSNADSDPLQAECKFNLHQDENDGKKEGSWIAIGLDFNKNGEFLGYVSRWCNGYENDDGEGHGIRFAVIVELNESCNEFVKVYDESGDIGDTTNKAWTDRIWEHGEYLASSGFFSQIFKTTQLQPYASLSLRGTSPLDPWLGIGNPYWLSYTFTNLVFDGFPYSCDETDSHRLGGVPTICEEIKTTGGSYATLKGINTHAVDRQEQEQDDNFSYQDANLYYLSLNDLFLKYFSIKSQNHLFGDDAVVDTLGDYVGGEYVGEDYSSNLGGQDFIGDTKPPQIFSINPSLCSRRDKDCIPGEADNITINMKNYTMKDYDDDGKDGDEDKSDFGRGTPDPFIQQGSVTVNARFFAFADDNRMPIRRVMVNWDDGTDVQNKDVKGMYRNHKPYCDDTDGNKTVGRCTGDERERNWAQGEPPITCKKDEECVQIFGDGYFCDDNIEDPIFGDAPRACQENYFEFEHTYYCNTTDIEVGDLRNDTIKRKYFGDNLSYADEAYARLMERSEITEETGICIFKPGVQVLDNWGWCNGVDGNGNPTAFFNDTTDHQCDDSTMHDYHFTKYKGAIIVIP
ncbi:MAG: hypothetical protein WCW16_05215 [Candidatus Magasanikbacteria bacterium]